MEPCAWLTVKRSPVPTEVRMRVHTPDQIGSWAGPFTLEVMHDFFKSRRLVCCLFAVPAPGTSCRGRLLRGFRGLCTGGADERQVVRPLMHPGAIALSHVLVNRMYVAGARYFHSSNLTRTPAAVIHQLRSKEGHTQNITKTTANTGTRTAAGPQPGRPSNFRRNPLTSAHTCVSPHISH